MVQISLRKQPVQARSQATCAAIKEAAARILVTRGIEALNTNLIAETAGVSVGTLYQYFPSKQAILAELIRDMRAEMLTDLQRGCQAAQGCDLNTTVRILIDATLDHHRRDAPRAEALEHAEATLRMDGETERLKADIHLLVVEILTLFGVDTPARAARDLAALARGMARAAVWAGETDFDDVAARITRAATGYLRPN